MCVDEDGEACEKEVKEEEEEEEEGQGREEEGVDGSHTQSMREWSMDSKHSTSRPAIHSLSSTLYPSSALLCNLYCSCCCCCCC